MLIGVDHGNKQIKTVHCAPFVSGLQQSMTRPFGPSLQYGGNYYTLSNERIPYRKDKTGDDRFFILTLIAIAEELTARGVDEKELYHIQLPVGLPPAHFGSWIRYNSFSSTPRAVNSSAIAIRVRIKKRSSPVLSLR